MIRSSLSYSFSHLLCAHGVRLNSEDGSLVVDSEVQYATQRLVTAIEVSQQGTFNLNRGKR